MKYAIESQPSYSVLELNLAQGEQVRNVLVDGKEFFGVAAGVVATFGREARPANGQRLAGLLGFTGFGKRVWTINYETLEIHLDD